MAQMALSLDFGAEYAVYMVPKSPGTPYKPDHSGPFSHSFFKRSGPPRFAPGKRVKTWGFRADGTRLWNPKNLDRTGISPYTSAVPGNGRDL